MAFKETQNIDGGGTYELGEHIAIYDKYMVSSGINASTSVIYERSDDGIWTSLSVVSGSVALNIGNSVDLYKGVAAVCSTNNTPASQEVIILTQADDFVSIVTLKQSSPVADSNFGSSVSISDNYIAVGSSEVNSNQGAVYIYEKIGSNWTTMTAEVQEIIPNDAIDNQFFGTSVAINDDFLIVGAKGDNLSRGAIYVFKRNEETDIFEQSQKIIAADGETGDEFGGQVSISGDYFAAGAEFADLSDQEVNVGAVYIFNYSTTWGELKKITGVDESGLIANNFGHSLDLKGDYLIVGSPSAQNSGVADIFYKKRNWGHLKKIDSTSTATDDNFGESVGIFYPYSVIGASGWGTDEGRVYIFEDPEVRLRLAQEFDADFQPSKASVYLKRSGSNPSMSWALSRDRATVIDATNFSSITQSNNKVVFDDRIVGFTGNGYMIMSPEEEVDIIDGSDSSFSIVNYPIRNSITDSYSVWIRCHDGNLEPSGGSLDPSISGSFLADILLDGIVVKSINASITEGEWSWVNVILVLPDTQQHILGIRMKEKSAIIDKIYIDADSDFIPEGIGPSNSTSPYVTIHMKVYDKIDFVFTAAENIVAQYKMNDNESSDVVVVNEYGDNGAYVGAANTEDVSVDGKINKALSVNGATQYIDTNQPFESTFKDSFSINFWVKPDDGHPDGDEVVFGVLSNSEEDEVLLYMNNAVFGFRYVSNDEGQISLTIPHNFDDGAVDDFMMLTMTLENGGVAGTTIGTICRNGVEIATDSDSFGMANYSSVINLFLGANNDDEISEEHFAGAIDNFCIFDKVLTQDEIDLLYNEGDGIEELGFVFELPNSPLIAYDYKTTLDEVIQDDWYNFNISFTHKIISEYGESLFLVMSTSGANADNFIVWEIVDSDEYLSYNVGLRLTEVGSNSNSEELSLTNRIYYAAKTGNSSLDTDTWYLDNTKIHAFKIYSDFDPIEDV